jgi:hypothetical protein
MRRHAGEPYPGLHAVLRMLVLDAQLVQHFGNLLARHDRVVDEKTFRRPASCMRSIWPITASPKVLAMICSTSTIDTSLPLASSVMAVM